MTSPDIELYGIRRRDGTIIQSPESVLRYGSWISDVDQTLEFIEVEIAPKGTMLAARRIRTMLAKVFMEILAARGGGMDRPMTRGEERVNDLLEETKWLATADGEK